MKTVNNSHKVVISSRWPKNLNVSFPPNKMQSIISHFTILQAFTGEFSFDSIINSPGTFKESSRRAL